MGGKIRAAVIAVTASVVAFAGVASAQAAPTSYIGGVVFHDLNADGVRQEGEPGISGVDVMVKGPDGGRYPFPTDAYGSWHVKRVPAGVWEVSYADPELLATTPQLVRISVEDDNGYEVDFGVRAA
ncbi:SdrD B-like domain-containing protein [Lentzea sp. NPDC058436]|uniref:SdrD B-like domain-containing protein n=1 Tax=Lentzea sp. NPDC058436 TaxID=3346499 RepID=UPI00365BF372